MLQLGRVFHTCSHTPGANSKSGECLHALGAEGIMHVNVLKRLFYFLEEKGPVYCLFTMFGSPACRRLLLP